MDHAIDDALTIINRAAGRGLPALVGIDGRSGAGKSTFAGALAAASDASLVEGDAFYAGGIGLRNDTAEKRAQACLDRPKLREVLKLLKSGCITTFRPFDWEAFDGSLCGSAITVEPRNVIIVEGVYSCHPDLVDLLDIRILLDVADVVRQERLIQREGSIGAWERQWHEAEDWYFANLATVDLFNLIIP